MKHAAPDPRKDRSKPRPPSPLERGLPEWVMIAVGLVALATLTAQHGFRLDDGAMRWLGVADVAIAVVFGAELLSCLVRSESRLLFLRQRWFELLLLALLLVSLTVFSNLEPVPRTGEESAQLGARSLPKLYLAAVQAYLLGVVVARGLRSQERWLERRLRPELVLVVSFGLLALVGTAFLLLPRARRAPSPCRRSTRSSPRPAPPASRGSRCATWGASCRASGIGS